MTLGALYSELLMALAKDQYGGYVTPSNFPDAINNVVSPALINAYIRHFEETREISDDIRPFLKMLGDGTYAPLPLTPFNGNAPYSYGEYPEDFLYFSDANYSQIENYCGGNTINRRSITWMARADFDEYTSSDLLFPDAKEPIASIQNGKIVVCPKLQSMNFAYIRKPNLVVFDYEIVGDDTVLYLPPGSVHTNSSTAPIGTPSTSVELEWPEQVHYEILTRLVQYYGRTTRDQLDLSMPNTKPE